MAVEQDLTAYKGEAVHYYFGLTPSTNTTRQVAAAATIVPVKSTSGFASSGTAYVLNPDTGTVTAITYTGTTATSLTGCANVPALAKEGALVTNGGTDITGWTIHATVRANATDAAALVGPAACAHTSELGGIFRFSLTSTQTKTTLGVGVFAYDIQRVDAGSESVLSIGELTVLQEVLYP